ncbi:putative chitobiose transport system substrate-binding protein [Chitinivorax tropicus]|uniref:Putative chitobiose transport system substrate-binding protein n=1 Tax=Chitinivorax tropicus TaxID=714531 RepID=A0A840MP27_9PROT|nr:putative chitobiose transport system substrate-binding protein [Chitinivorax tropicus]
MSASRHLLASLAALMVLSQPADAAEKQRLEFWTNSLKPKFTQYFETLEKLYEQQHPNIDVVWVDIPWDAFETRLMAAIGAGKPPALANLEVPWVYDAVQRGLLRPLDEAIGTEKDYYLDGAIQDVTFDGKLWAIPFYNNADIIAYNTALFKQAGLDPTKPPQTLQDQLDYAKQIRQKTGTPGLAPPLGKMASIFLQEGLPVLQNGKAAFNTPRHAALLKRFADAYQAGALLKDKLFAEDNFQQNIDAYNSGRLAMMATAPTALSRTRDNASHIYQQTAVAQVPLGPTGIAPGGWLFTYAVPKGVDDKTFGEAIKLARFLTRDDNQLAFSKLAGTFPTSKGAVNDPFFKVKPAQSGAFEQAVQTAAGHAERIRTLYVAGLPDANAMLRKLQLATEQAVTGRKRPEIALAEAAAFWDHKLATQKGPQTGRR